MIDKTLKTILLEALARNQNGHGKIIPELDISEADLLAQAMDLGEGARRAMVEEILAWLDEKSDAGEGYRGDEEATATLQLLNTLMTPPYYAPVPELIDGDIAGLVARQKAMMAAIYEPMDDPADANEMAGLAQQQYQLEQRHALRLLLGFDTAAELATHLKRCLADPEYGYGERGDNGLLLAQMLNASPLDFRDAVREWWEFSAEFRKLVRTGHPFDLLPLGADVDIDDFIPVLQRVGDTAWRLGIEGFGKHQDFEGDIWKLWPKIMSELVQWTEEDNENWLVALQQQAAQLPYNIQRAAQSDRLLFQSGRCTLIQKGPVLEVQTVDVQPPRHLPLGDDVLITRFWEDDERTFYELAWEGGGHIRQFELPISPIEHTETVLAMAEVLAGDGVRAELAPPEDIEGAYLRRVGATKVVLGPPPAVSPLIGVKSNLSSHAAPALNIGDPSSSYYVAP